MGLLSIFKRTAASGEAAAPGPSSQDGIDQARSRARHRLIGSVVLVVAGVIGFPLLFETEQRPLPTDLPIEIPAKDTAAPRVQPVAPAAETPARAPARSVSEEAPAETQPEAPQPVAAAPAPAPAAAPTPPARTAAETEAARARALLEGRPAAAAAQPDSSSRFVVQVGAFSEASSAREVRAKVEKLGLKTYTQVVDTSTGQRIRVRVGPFTSREQAQQAADKLKAAGLPGAVLTL